MYDDIANIFHRPSPMAMALLGYHQARDLRAAEEERKQRADRERMEQWFMKVKADLMKREMEEKSLEAQRKAEVDNLVGPLDFAKAYVAPTIAEREAPGSRVEGAPYEGAWSIHQPGAEGYGPSGYVAGGAGGVLGGGYAGSGGAAQAPTPPTLLGPDPAAVAALRRMYPSAPLPDLAAEKERYRAGQVKAAADLEKERAQTLKSLRGPDRAPILRQDASGQWVAIDPETGQVTPTGVQGRLPREPRPQVVYGEDGRPYAVDPETLPSLPPGTRVRGGGGGVTANQIRKYDELAHEFDDARSQYERAKAAAGDFPEFRMKYLSWVTPEKRAFASAVSDPDPSSRDRWLAAQSGVASRPAQVQGRAGGGQVVTRKLKDGSTVRVTRDPSTGQWVEVP